MGEAMLFDLGLLLFLPGSLVIMALGAAVTWLRERSSGN